MKIGASERKYLKLAIVMKIKNWHGLTYQEKMKWTQSYWN